ncbi:EVE domain-containing protein [Trichormus sp. NMC-1]|uniref:EVE domain-containing protein n=1 Tax=Trichormus sp. NMC-1 TaxID=1853259 RepID=UPI0031BB68C3
MDLERDCSTVWDGVNHPLGFKHMQTMLPHNLALIYHTGKERQVMGIEEIYSQADSDPAWNDSKGVVVDLRASAKGLSIPHLSQN